MSCSVAVVELYLWCTSHVSRRLKMEDPLWRSIQRRKPSWSHGEVHAIALDMARLFPAGLVGAMAEGRRVDGALFTLDRNGYKAVARNYRCLDVVTAHFPDKVPSTFLLADVCLELHKVLHSMLLPEPAEASALQEGIKCKKLMQVLRNLFRRSPGAKVAEVELLKAKLRPRESASLKLAKCRAQRATRLSTAQLSGSNWLPSRCLCVCVRLVCCSRDCQLECRL